jgi:uncharacterized protein (TIGR00369 family)
MKKAGPADFLLDPSVSGAPSSGMKVLPHTHSCFVCGDSNALGLNLRFETDGCRVKTRFTPRPEHVGFKGIIHGGILATVLDEIMVWACAVQTKKFGFCAELNVRFIAPASLGNELIATAELLTNQRDRIFSAKAELESSTGEILARATGKYIPVKTPDVADMLADFAGEGMDWLAEAK